MSKSLRNVVNPDDVIAQYGADTMRLYEMYMGPLEASAPWNTRDIIGVHRFLQRSWRLVIGEEDGALDLRDEPDEGVERLLHRTIAKVGGDIERLAFNTAIAAMIEWVNEATGVGITRDQLDDYIERANGMTEKVKITLDGVATQGQTLDVLDLTIGITGTGEITYQH